MDIRVDPRLAHFFNDHRIIRTGIDHDPGLPELLAEFGNGLEQIFRIAVFEGAHNDQIEGGVPVCF